MNKDEGNFLWGVAAGWFLHNNNDNNNKNKGGCISSIIGLGIIIFVIHLIRQGELRNFFTKLAVYAVCIVVIIILVKILKSGYSKAAKIADEGWQLFNDKQFTLALEKSEPIADKNASAATMVGLCYMEGLGCDVNYEKAFHFFQCGQKQDVEARAMYGYMLTYGIGCQANPEEGIKILKKSALIEKQPISCLRYGEIVAEGLCGVERNITEGIKCLRVAMDANLPYAKYLVGKYQYEGVDGVSQNIEKGLELLQAAANENVADAQNYLSNLKQD